MPKNNLYSIEKLQALDTILKMNTRLYNEKGIYQNNLKLVIQVNGILWYGDFVRILNNRLSQIEINTNGDVYERNYLLSEIPFIIYTHKSYYDFVKNYFYGDPLTRTTDLSIALNFLTKFLDQLNNENKETPLYPYLFKAQTLDGKCQLPFLDLKDENLSLVSMLKINSF